jgi:hypothetical protein
MEKLIVDKRGGAIGPSRSANPLFGAYDGGAIANIPDRYTIVWLR